MKCGAIEMAIYQIKVDHTGEPWRNGYALLSVGDRTAWRTKRIAEKHMREWKGANWRDAWVEECSQ
jgi:hypothetical protein